MAEEENLVSRRPRRSTAGNRMELALAELALEEPEMEEDLDFINDKEEEDVFESDFASTDEEAVQEDVDAGDKAVQDEERRERKTARSRVEKATALAHARQRVTFNPEASSSQPKPKPTQKIKRRVSLGVAVNAETGEIIEGSPRGASGKRHSQRRHTIMNTSATVSRMKDAEVKRAAVPKKTKVITRAPTQDELIASALDTEEVNIIEHRDYLRLEDEKRARARLVRRSIEGPVLRWISKKEIVKVPVPPPPPPPTQTLASHYSFVYAPAAGPVGGSGSTATITPTPSNALFLPTSVPYTPTPLAPTPYYTVAPPIPPAQPPLPPPEERTEVVCKNYVVHEIPQAPGKPPWEDTMTAMFGDHVRWEELKVFTGKGRPLSRPVRACPITGVPAKYLDPRTNVPYANLGAYQTLTKILSHEYVWSEALGCYVTPGGGGTGTGDQDQDQAQGGERISKRRKVGTEGG
ncbi:hypothetical protein HYDPIDRAFT_98548 [Hydnomerulius pinastri MD-312]|uniref:Vps72/YL1 C-terminal domain-containing protein n=1 Tax=Hydnomerulius pinastri MD-312 TaxID=994086 RepID=A0A0C9W357_9AGAM|nr:hypothetical protein HYDPIDRAFT_98548 [Hydnomerulius pinastri MD-312]